MASRRDEKQARRDERTQGVEGRMRRTTQTLVTAARNAGHSPNRIREDLLRGIKDVLGLAAFDTSAMVVDSRTQAIVDYSNAYKVICDQERIELFDPRVCERWLSIVQDELDRALRRVP
jgi:hypothetical protein